MSRGQVSCTNRSCPCRSQSARADQRIELDIQYTDKKQSVKLHTGLKCTPKITISNLIKDFLDFLCLDDISPENVRLVELSINGRCSVASLCDTSIITLHDLNVTNGSILYFEPSPTAPPPKACHLTIVGPDEITKKNYEWYTTKTTLRMLLEYTIKNFSLETVERERIHLVTIFKELNLFDHSERRLGELDIHDGMNIFVQIIPSRSSPIINENTDVHVECTYGNEKSILDVPNTITIDELKNAIEKQLEDWIIIDFKLYDRMYQEIHLSDSDRKLNTIGVKPNQTIYATFRLLASNAQPLLVNNRSETSPKTSLSLSTKHKGNEVTVVCQYSPHESETFSASMKDTVGDLINKVETRIKNRRLVLSDMRSGSKNIDIKQPHRCLADLGIKSSDVISAIMKDKPFIHSSIVSTQTSSSPKTDKLSKTKRDKLKPIGLDNLGNTCYMNSAFQCLAHVIPLTDFFLEGIDQTHSNDGDHTDNEWNPFDEVGEVTGAYAELLWNLWRSNENDDSFKPTYIKERIGKNDSRFSTTDQQDAQEFMTFLLDAIHEELKKKNKYDNNTIIKQLFFGEIQSTITCTKCDKQESTTSPISFLSIPLSRQERTFWVNYIPKSGKDETASVTVPIGGRVGHLVEAFAKLWRDPQLFYFVLAMIPDGELDYETSLSEISGDEVILMEQEDHTDHKQPERLETHSKTSTLENCLEEFFSVEELEDKWSCQQEKCKKKTKATKQLKLCTLPSVLIIQFKRFSHENGFHQKVDTFVEYPIEGLDLSSLASTSSENAMYDLIAVSHHMGSISGGHYTAFARRTIKNKTEWFKFDDSSVSRVPTRYYEEDIVTKDAYLLFYVKRDILKQTTTTTIVTAV